MSEQLPRVVGRRYRLTDVIGKGGSGTVYLADDMRLSGRRCAVKAVDLDAADGDSIAHLSREATILTQLDHPALPKVSDILTHSGKLHVIMDYVAGEDLRAVTAGAWQRGRSLSVEQVLGWAEELCAVLTYLHRQSPPVIHRDVKPANVKLTPDGQLRLVDFGLAQTQVQDGRTVTILGGGGSRPYQPLEQYGDGAAVDARSDIYALAATLYHLLAGSAPATAQARFLDQSALMPLEVTRSDIPPWLAAAIGAGMAIHPDDRPADAEAFRRLLLPTLGPESGAGAVVDALAANAWLMAAITVLALAALAVSVAP